MPAHVVDEPARKPGDIPDRSEHLAHEEETEENIAGEEDPLEGMPEGAKAAHRIMAGLHGLKDVIGAHDHVEGPMRKPIDDAKSIMDKLDSHFRTHHEKNYGKHKSYKDLPVYDMEGGETEETFDDEHEAGEGGTDMETETAKSLGLGSDTEEQLRRSIQRELAEIERLSR
jgi:hypothetical protein